MQYTIPDLVSACPLKDATNPHYDEVTHSFRAWIESWGISTEQKRNTLNKIRAELLASHTYPKANLDRFRMCSEVLHVLWVIDEISDEQTGKDARSTAAIFRKVITDLEWNDGTALAAMMIDVRNRFLPLAGPRFLRRFLRSFDLYVDSVSREAELRGRGEILDMESFTALRRGCSGTYISLDLCELAVGIDLPDEVAEDPVVKRLFVAAADLVCWSNDIYSYNLEHATGVDGANVVTALKKNLGLDLQDAMDYAGDYWKKLMDEFMADKARLPSWGPEVDSMVASYVEGLGNWVIGSIVWSFDTQRYFGPNHLEIKKTRRITLRNPRASANSI